MPAPSRFLPDNFETDAPVALIAGRRLYPLIIAQRMRECGIPCRLIAFEGETSDELWNFFPESERAMIKVGQLGHMLKSLKKLGARYALMAGQIAPGRLFRELHPDLKAIQILATLKERNAESIFGAISNEVEKIGVSLLDARSFMDEDMASAGVMTKGKLKAAPEYIAHGIRIAKEVARLDIGQGVVVRKGTVLSVEAFEGTDDMLSRSNKYKTDKLIFVKTTKPRQDWRFDVPVFGMQTVEKMHESGITTACLEVDGTIILEKKAVLEKAREWGMEIYGYSHDSATA
ncbi:MAG: UDP-2,3-diacylglucosamine diphosphatase LpxI [Opitutales bacterium]|nr:UDP-2,3-diacylglucosamine diphosphatase LpxI [Opitutales bacterium]